MSKNKTKTTQKETATVAPNAAYAPNIDAAAASLAPSFAAASANNTGYVMPMVQGVNSFNQGVMNGSMLNGNPHLQGMIDQTAQSVGNNVASRFSAAGRYGSGNHAGVLARELANAENGMRFQNYSQERAYQDAAGGKVLQGATIAAGIPQAAASTYADQVAALLGKYTTGNSTGSGTQTQKQGLLGSLLGAGASAAGGILAGGR